MTPSRWPWDEVISSRVQSEISVSNPRYSSEKCSKPGQDHIVFDVVAKNDSKESIGIRRYSDFRRLYKEIKQEEHNEGLNISDLIIIPPFPPKTSISEYIASNDSDVRIHFKRANMLSFFTQRLKMHPILSKSKAFNMWISEITNSQISDIESVSSETSIQKTETLHVMNVSYIKEIFIRKLKAFKESPVAERFSELKGTLRQKKSTLSSVRNLKYCERDSTNLENFANSRLYSQCDCIASKYRCNINVWSEQVEQFDQVEVFFEAWLTSSIDYIDAAIRFIDQRENLQRFSESTKDLIKKNELERSAILTSSSSQLLKFISSAYDKIRGIDQLSSQQNSLSRIEKDLNDLTSLINVTEFHINLLDTSLKIEAEHMLNVLSLEMSYIFAIYKKCKSLLYKYQAGQSASRV